MADITVGSDIHAFMQSASQEQMRDRIGLQDVVGPQFAARQMAGYGISDGATANRGEILTPGAIGAVTSLPLTILAVLDVPSANISATARLFYANSQFPLDFTEEGVFIFSLFTDGNLRIQQNNASSTQWERYNYSGFRADYSGVKGLSVAIIFTEGNSSTKPRFEINGVDVSSSFTIETLGTGSNWMPNNVATTYVGFGLDWPSGRVPYVRAIIGALSTDESATWGTTGELPTWATQAGSAVDTLSHGEFTDFTGSTPDGWTTGVSITTAETTDGVQITGNGLTNSGNNSLVDTGGFSGFGVGDPFYYELRARRVGGSAGDILYFTRDTGDKELDLELTQSTPAWEVWSGTLTISDNDGSGQNQLRLGTTAAANWEVDYIKILRPGLIDDPYYQPALATGDRLGRMSRRLLGITPVPALGQNDFIVIGNTDSSAAGGEQILGGPVIDVGTTVIDSIEQVPASGTPTTSVGSATGALTTYVASAALAAGVNPSTLATRKVATANLWAKSDGTMVVRTFVRGHQISTPV